MEGEENVKVDQAGVVEGLTLGDATIKVYHLLNREVTSFVFVTVERTAPIEFAVKSDAKRLSQTTGTVELLRDPNGGSCQTDIQILDEDGLPLLGVFSAYEIVGDTFHYSFEEDGEFVGKVVVKLTVTTAEESFYDYFTITRVAKTEVRWADEDWGEND